MSTGKFLETLAGKRFSDQRLIHYGDKRFVRGVTFIEIATALQRNHVLASCDVGDGLVKADGRLEPAL